ncbi:hypothetical protein ES703_88178 [subsurface metagenome]
MEQRKATRGDFELEEPFKPPVYRFSEQSAKEKEAAAKEWVEQAYWQAFGDLGLVRVEPITHKDPQLRGYDRACHFKNGNKIFFDEKHRPRDYGDILIEIWSDMERRIRGWLDSSADYIAEFFEPTRRVVWLPLLLLNKWLKTRKEIVPWMDNPENETLLPCPPWNRVVTARNIGKPGYPDYTTASIAGPNELVLGGILQVSHEDLLPGQTPLKTWLAYHKKRGVVLRGPDGRVIDWLWCLSMWDKLGRPVVYAGPRDPFYDLSIYVYPERLSPQKLQGIAAWLEEYSR